MASLASLKLTAAQKPAHLPEIQQRRNKLIKRLHEQVEMAKAQQAGTQYYAVKFTTQVDKETGQRKSVEAHKRVKQWWFTADNGKLCLSVRFGPKVLELAKNKYAVEIAGESDLLPTLELIKTAVLEGELDSAIENAASKLREGFRK